MEITLRENERIDDLERNGYRIIQNKSRFCFGMDAVLLSGFACNGETGAAWANEKTGKKPRETAESEQEVTSGASPQREQPKQKKELKAVDLGTGTGIIPILMYGRLRAGTYIGLEIQDEVADMAARSVALNSLEGSVKILQGDIKTASDLLGTGTYDVVTSNPPYMRNGGGIANPDSSRAISRHEVLCTFHDVAREAAALLHHGGRFYLVHRPERLAELIVTLKGAGLEPKRLRMVHSFRDSEATMVLIESVKGGGSFLKVEAPLIIYREKGVYTEEIRRLYSF